MTEHFNTLDSNDQKFKLDEIILDAGISTFDKWLSELNTSEATSSKTPTTSSDMLTDNSDSDRNTSDFWRPAVPFNKAIFAAFITYVDENGTLYMYDFHKKAVLDDIRNAIDERFAKLVNSPATEPINWAKNDACLARFHLDGQYHRAVVLAISDTTVEVTVSNSQCCYDII